ncbi:MAG: hypothetical protein J0H55_04495 [Chitinophagaceae bacterium]|nr:hypothetical protein [Chitinophagaceae bacterium]
MLDEVLTRIAGISSRIQKLTADYSMLENELQKTSRENLLLKEKQSSLEEEIRQMKEQIFILKASNAPLGDDDKKEFQKSLNEYLRTVDKCISLLKT